MSDFINQQKNIEEVANVSPQTLEKIKARAQQMNKVQQFNQLENEENFVPPNKNTPQQNINEKMYAPTALRALLDRISTYTYETIYLPSKGKFYNSEPLSSGVLHIRQITGGEEEILATPNLHKKNEAMDLLLKKCIQEAIDPSQLLSIDRNYIFIYLRGISYGPEYRVNLTCPKCEKTFPQIINLSYLVKNDCPDDLEPDNLVGTLPKTGLNFSYRLSTGRDEILIMQNKSRKTGNIDDSMSYTTSLMLKNIDEITSQKELQILLQRLPAIDSTYIREKVSKQLFGVDTDVDIRCDICGHDFRVNMPWEASFFFPQSTMNSET